MTPSTIGPVQGYIAALPATLAGLWTAITLTHDIAAGLCDPADPDTTDRRRGITEACAQAAECLAGCRTTAFPEDLDRPTSRNLGPVDGLALAGALASDCIDLAVDVLGNEGEPLTPVEVLAVTRSVTALCTARTLARAGAE
jgi:hypothetical protein